MDIRTVGVVGCGQMGSGIVEVVARAGYEVIVLEVNDEFLQRGLARVQASMERAVKRGKMTAEERDSAWARIRGTTNMDDFHECELVIEAAIEQLDIKQNIFKELDDITPKEALLASNTSSISLTALAAATSRPDKVLGLHFFNPAPVMPLVEIVRAVTTSDESVAIAQHFVDSLGKKPVLAKDTPGFIVNRLLVPYLIDAIRMYEQGLASKEDIDSAMKLGANHPMGPLQLSDFIGLDTLLYVAEVLYEELAEPRLAPPPLLRRMVAAGFLGRKSGRGFYEYE